MRALPVGRVEGCGRVRRTTLMCVREARTVCACVWRSGASQLFYPLIQACAYYGLTESGLVDWEKNSELITNVYWKIVTC